MLWSYDKPTKAGLYFCNLGDTVDYIHLSIHDLVHIKGELFDEADLARNPETAAPVSKWNISCKFRPVDYEYLNKIGNKAIGD